VVAAAAAAAADDDDTAEAAVVVVVPPVAPSRRPVVADAAAPCDATQPTADGDEDENRPVAEAAVPQRRQRQPRPATIKRYDERR